MLAPTGSRCRANGHRWTEIAQALGTNPDEARLSFDPESPIGDASWPYNQRRTSAAQLRSSIRAINLIDSVSRVLMPDSFSSGTQARYDQTGQTYSRTRRPDPRISAVINEALLGMATAANIGAGTGSYEPACTVIAVEPSRVMIAQRPPGSAPAIQAVAEHLPIRSNAVDVALGVLTVHHWSGLDHGVAEMRRIARRRVVIFTWDNNVFRRFWLVREYLPAAAQTDADLAIPITKLISLLGDPTIIPVPVPHDCVDGFGGAYWRRPHAYLDQTVQAGMSLFALTPKPALREGLSRLRADLASGEWDRQHQDLLESEHLDLGYRLLVAELT